MLADMMSHCSFAAMVAASKIDSVAAVGLAASSFLYRNVECFH
jgi:hypothetical protein